MVGIDDQEIDSTDEAARLDRWAKSQNGSTHDLALRLRHEDTGLRQVDELTEQIRRPERTRATVSIDRLLAQGDESIDVRHAGGSDQVFHAEGSFLAGGDRLPSTGVADTWSVRGRIPSFSANGKRSGTSSGCGRPVLHSGRRCV